MKILVATDAHSRIPSGVRTFNENVGGLLSVKGHELIVFDTFDANYIPDPTRTVDYAALMSKNKFKRFYQKVQPDAVHIASEGLVGYSARCFCKENQIPFTAAYHTNLEYLAKKKLLMPGRLIWKYLRHFYSPAQNIHVSTPRLEKLLRDKNITNEIVEVRLGVDKNRFFYEPNQTSLSKYKRPFFMNMGRQGKEKNLEAFLDLDLPGTKFLIGGGPSQSMLMRKYKDRVVFLEYQNAREYLSQADVFVVPSHFETFGLVMIEALSCGVPVAGFPVMGPVDVIDEGITGFTSNDLKKAALSCLTLKKEDCIKATEQYTWEKTTEEFLANLCLINVLQEI